MTPRVSAPGKMLEFQPDEDGCIGVNSAFKAASLVLDSIACELAKTMVDLAAVEALAVAANAFTRYADARHSQLAYRDAIGGHP